MYIHRVVQPSALSNFRMLLSPQKEGIFQKAKGQPLCLILMYKSYMVIKMKVDFRNVTGTIRSSCAKAKLYSYLTRYTKIDLKYMRLHVKPTIIKLGK